MTNSRSRREGAAVRRREIRSKSEALELDDGRPRFIADVMVGRLAKWLRIAGFDVLYSNRFSDDELVELSRKEDRILLSRDTRLLLRKAVKRFIYLESGDVLAQVKQVFAATRTRRIPGLHTRCFSCNELLVEIPREKVRTRVPPYVYATHIRFKICPRCRKIYWAGTHRKATLKILESLLPE